MYANNNYHFISIRIDKARGKIQPKKAEVKKGPSGNDNNNAKDRRNYAKPWQQPQANPKPSAGKEPDGKE